MTSLVCVGLGYSAAHYVAAHGKRFDRIVGTARSRGRNPDVVVFDGRAASPAFLADIRECDALLISAPPDDRGDPVLACCADAIATSKRLRAIVYLSSVGVYGDHDGAWVDETSAPRAASPRAKARLKAEAAWRDIAARNACAVAILRLAGIYGPGRNALVNLAAGTAHRIVKPGQVFNRIHVADIAQAIEASFARAADGIFNVADDHPAPPQDVIAFAAALRGVALPPEIPFAQAARTMSAMAASFYAENRRVRNEKLKTALGVRLSYPTYREGLAALAPAGD